jgi:2-polyprenyl-3-methyl-5-hydroxy-6-metoxy-1,4-benzoquinol methylase
VVSWDLLYIEGWWQGKIWYNSSKGIDIHMKATEHKSYDEKPDNYYVQGRPEMVERVPTSAQKVLDIGCSTGAFGRLLKEKRPDVTVWGVEMHGPTAKEAAKHLDKVFNSSIEEALDDLPKGEFDAIVFNDVLEHLIDPVAVLEMIKPLLASEGVVISSIPNVRYYYNLTHMIFEKDFRYEDDGIRDHTHVRFFTDKSIRRMYEETGYSVVSQDGIAAIPGWKFALAKRLALGLLDDAAFMQFATVARINK